MNTRTFEILNGAIQSKVSNKAKISLERTLAKGANLQRGKQQQRYSVLGQVQGEGEACTELGSLVSRHRFGFKIVFHHFSITWNFAYRMVYQVAYQT